jgi:hypothetical protein
MTTNSDAVLAFRQETQVTTLGNTDDAVYLSENCNIDVPVFGRDNLSTMVVNGSGGGLARLGGNLPTPPLIHTLITTKPYAWPSSLSQIYDDCVSSSHKQITIVDAPLVASIIGAQSSGATPAASAPSTPAPVGASLGGNTLTVALYNPPGSSGSATLSLQAPASGLAAADAGLARGRLVTIGRARFRLAPGVQRIRVKLNPAGRRLARRGRLTSVTVTVVAGPHRFTDTLTLRRARGRR